MPRTSKGTRKNRKTKPSTLPDKFQSGFLGTLDGRSELARALTANREAILDDVGGAADVSHVKNALIERFVWLEGVLQTLEHEMATGTVTKHEALGRWIQGLNALSGLAKALGTDRVNSSTPWLTQPPAAATNGSNGTAATASNGSNGNGKANAPNTKPQPHSNTPQENVAPQVQQASCDSKQGGEQP